MDADQKRTTDSEKSCSITIPLEEQRVLNETNNGATICVKKNSILQMELPDFSRTGGEWRITKTGGIQLSDEGTVWYDENNVPTTIPGLGRGIHTWKIRIAEAGTQKIHAELQYPARGGSAPERVFDVTCIAP